MKINLFFLATMFISLAIGHRFTMGDGRILDRLMGRSRVIFEHRITYDPVVPTTIMSSPPVIYSRPATPMIPPCPVNLAPLPAVPKFGER